MTLLLQNKRSLAFIEGVGGAWTKDRERAHPFAHGLEALIFCFDRRLKDMQMVASFLDPKKNFSVPVADVSAE